MKYINCFLIGAFAFLCSCSSDEPKQDASRERVRLASVVAADNSMRSYSYDKQGRITRFDGISDDLRVKTLYSYPSSDRIVVDYTATDLGNVNRTVSYHEEFILSGGRAESSEGTYEMTGVEDGESLLKSFRRDFSYNEFRQLVAVMHSEVYGNDGFDTSSSSWNQPWSWVNRIVWDNENIVEYDDFDGSSSPRRISKFSYFADVADGCAVVLPDILEPYTEPLMKAGVFGPSSKNLLASVAVRDNRGDLLSSSRYDYDFADGLVKSYYETVYGSTGASSSMLYEVNWTSY